MTAECTYTILMTHLKFNVAQLLREAIGARRDYDFAEDRLPLDTTLVLRNIAGSVRFTRTAGGVYAHIQARGAVRLVCVRSLEEFDQLVELDISEELHSVIDVTTGVGLPKPSEEDPFFLDELHMADIGEVIREYTLLELPLNPVCEAYRNTPVNYTVQSEGVDEETEDGVDERLEVLKMWSARQNDKSEL